MNDWFNDPAPTHRCTICGALWRYWLQRDSGSPDSWSLHSNACGKCCDNVAMGGQIVRLTMGDFVELLRARFAVDVMTHHLFGPKPNDERH